MTATNSTPSHSAAPAGAPKLSRYMQRIEAKRLRRLNPHPLTKRARARNNEMRATVIRYERAADDAVMGVQS